MRMRIEGHRKYFQKSLRTKDKTSAIEKATYEFASVIHLKKQGKAVFSPTVYTAVKKYWKVYDKVIGQLEKKQAKEEAIFERAIENDNKGKTEKGLATIGRQQIDYLSEANIEEAMLKEGYLKTYEERTKRKRYIRTHTHRLLAKAEANIKAVGKGTFGVGHYIR